MGDQPDIALVRERTIVSPSAAAGFRLAGRATSETRTFPAREDAERSLRLDAELIDRLQEALFAERRQALLVVLQGVDASGKDGVTKAVFSRVSPLGVRAHAFGRPSEEELRHDFLWRVHRAVPPAGYIGVFNRSHYEDVLAARVRALRPEDEIERRYDQINQFERHLSENGVRLLKIMLHISRAEQGRRLRERLSNPEKRWKFSVSDLEDREHWSEYQEAYEVAIRRCCPAQAPWHVVPADSKVRRNALVARLVAGALSDMRPAFPAPKTEGVSVPD